MGKPISTRKELERLAEETDFRIPRNHRASDEQNDNHNTEFHMASHLDAHVSLRPLAENARAPKWGGGSRVLGIRKILCENSAGSFDISVGKDLGGESFNGGILAPRIQR